jgi:hypothetical protein
VNARAARETFLDVATGVAYGALALLCCVLVYGILKYL